MSYQDRKDIDALFDLVWDNNNNQTQFTTREEFEEFKNYIKSNYSMSAFIDALASNMDDNGLALFENLQDGLNELETNLNGLQSNLTNLNGQLNGDSTHTGFVNVLTNLQHHLYGEGDEDGEGNPYTYAYPSSSSLKGLLDALRGSLGELSEGDTQLAVTLSDLKSKLVGFSGTLTQFRNQIRQELGDTAYEQLNQDLLELIFNIASTNDQIDDHQQRIQATETLIGTEEDSASTQDGTAQNPYTVYGILNDTSDVASEANDSANDLIDTLYRGTGNNYNPNADPEHPADNTTLQWLGDTSTTANKVDGYVGDVSKFTEATISEALKNRADGETAMRSDINSLQTQIGSVNVSGSLRSDINSLQTNIGNVSILGGSSVSVALHNSIVNIGDVSLFEGDISSQLYVSLKQLSDLYKANIVEEVDNNYHQLGYDYLYHISSETWYKWNSSQNKYVKMTGETFSFLNVLSTRIQTLLNLVYAQESHTHSKSEITDFNHTHTKSNISDFSHSHGNITNDGKITTTPSSFNNQDYFVAVDNTTGVLSKQKMLSASSVYDNQASSYTNIGQLNQNTSQKTINNNINTALGNKQGTIPNFSVKTTQTMYGLTVTTYSDDFNVYLKISGTLNNSSDLPNGGNRSQIGTLSNTAYAPPSEMQTTVHSANAPNWSRITVKPNGEVYFQNGVSSKTYPLECSFYYPLKSRMPSSS